jgi:hypothetical protein
MTRKKKGAWYQPSWAEIRLLVEESRLIHFHAVLDDLNPSSLA